MRRRGGFTLVEMLVALAIAGTVALLANRIFGVVTDGVRQIREARSALDRDANARRWLAAAFLSLEVGQEGTIPFEGAREGVAFSARLRTERGWYERRAVRLFVTAGDLVAEAGASGRVTLGTGVSGVAFDYLLEPGADTRWASAWTSPVSAPLAVRLRIERAGAVDTALYLVKERG